MCSLIIDPKNQSPPTTSIALQTRKCTDIPNSQTTNIIEADIEAQMLKFREKHLGIIVRPNTITGIYNCHGMTFASRRTGIDMVHGHIIEEDNYVQLDNSAILPGDIVAYVSENGDIEHTGMVLSISENKNIMDTFILSKWGDGSEVIHALYNCPYEKSNIKFYRCEK